MNKTRELISNGSLNVNLASFLPAIGIQKSTVSFSLSRKMNVRSNFGTLLFDLETVRFRVRIKVAADCHQVFF